MSPLESPVLGSGTTWPVSMSHTASAFMVSSSVQLDFGLLVISDDLTVTPESG